MALHTKRTRIQRKKKKGKSGARSKRIRQNRGSTVRIPLTGELPSARFGLAVNPESILVPETVSK